MGLGYAGFSRELSAPQSCQNHHTLLYAMVHSRSKRSSKRRLDCGHVWALPFDFRALRNHSLQEERDKPTQIVGTNTPTPAVSSVFVISVRPPVVVLHDSITLLRIVYIYSEDPLFSVP